MSAILRHSPAVERLNWAKSHASKLQTSAANAYARARRAVRDHQEDAAELQSHAARLAADARAANTQWFIAYYYRPSGLI